MIIFAEQNIAISKRGIYIALVNEKDSMHILCNLYHLLIFPITTI